MKTTRPLEIIYFYIFPSQTKDEGTVYTFIALDDYSEFLFFLGTESNIDELSIINNIIRLTQNKDFAGRFNNKPLTLMLPFEKGVVPHDLITEVLKIFKCSVVYDPDTVSEKMKPVVDFVMRGSKP